MILLLVLFCAVPLRYSNGFPVIDDENSEEVPTRNDTFLKYLLATANGTSSKDYFPHVISDDQEELKSLTFPRVISSDQEELKTLASLKDFIPRAISDDQEELKSLTFPRVISSDQEELKSLVDVMNKQDLENSERFNLDSDPESDNENNVVIVNIDVETGTIAVDSVRFEDTVTAWDTWPWFFLAFGIALLMKLVFFCRKEQNKIDIECQLQNVGKI